MRKSQSASKGGAGIRLGVRTRTKHKKLDAISEDVYNRNRRVKMESNEGTSRGECVGNDSELRRSSRTRRTPVILDSSPPPSKKRRKLDQLGKIVREGSGKKVKGKGKLKIEALLSSSANSEEELGAWKARLRSKSKKIRSVSLIGSENQPRPRGKRKLSWDDDDEEEMNFAKDEQEDELLRVEREELRALKATEADSDRASVDGEDELCDDHSADGRSENGVDDAGDGGVCDIAPSTSEVIIGNEELVNGSPSHLVEKESEDATGILPEETFDRTDSMGDNELNSEPLGSEKLDGADNQEQVAEATARPTDITEGVQPCDVMNEVVAEAKEKHAEVENGTDTGNCNVTAGGIPRSRVKEGRRCGLCGGGTNGKPPKVMSNDSTGSENETYSGSSASDECNYDPWDGFGDEPGWLGKLLGPVNDRHGIAGIWVHQHCAVWSPEVYFAGLGCLKNIRAALCRGRVLKCTRCGRPGATLGCRVDRCPRTYHLPCARASGCIFDHRKFLIACADHRYLFQPHGHQYVQRIKKLKAKKMKLELKKLSNDASRKDLEAEEKWLEKCGEDEEFLRRETKRLQRDLLRIAPVYIGGSHSGSENPFEGWESVAGLQDVIQCMKEVVILPLLYPEFFENMGITPPRGVLLHGYPGTGKTLVVRALIGSCSRGDKRIAYFARKGADCLGKYVGDAERQLRLLFQVAEKSQPSIIFFDEIDGLAPVRTRQQDQTHSSVVSTLLALMDGLKNRGSVIVIGATNRPDAVDPALRRPGRFDREIYFPLPSMKDRAAILALHTKKWPNPVSGTLLEWVAGRTVGFAGADLQALCAQVAVIALKRNCSWNQILTFAGDNSEQGRRPHLPSFAVEERDWLEALSLAPPPCSRREAGIAANEAIGFPLHMHLIPFLLQPLLSLMISLYVDDRLWLPLRLVNAGVAIKRVVVSLLEKKGLHSDKWWCHAPGMLQDPDTSKEIVRNLSIAGILDGDASGGYFSSDDTSFGDGGNHPRGFDFNPSGPVRNLCYAPSTKTGYRILISGDPSSGQKHLASCLLHCFVGSIEMQKVDLATISQEGHGDLAQGISHILMKCASVKLCALFMPRIDLWAITSCTSVSEDVEVSTDQQSSKALPSLSCQIGLEKCGSSPRGSESTEVTEYQDESCSASQIWRSFVEQLECTLVTSSLIILATSEIPSSALPRELQQFFSSELLTSKGSVLSEYGIPRFSLEMEGKFDHYELIQLSAINLSRDLVQQYVQLVHIENHRNLNSRITSKAHGAGERDMLSHRSDLKSVEESRAKQEPAESSIAKSPVAPSSRNVKGKSSLVLAITTLGYQILRYPHFAELCWVTSKLNNGPSADIRGPWKGWPFNSCVVRPWKSTPKETVACNTSSSRGKDQFTLVRGLIAVGLSAYRGIYTSPAEISLEVRKVLELLVEQIAAKIQAGKDRCQYIRLLSQVAYLEDMVNNWSYSLRSLEPDSQTSVTSKLNGAQTAETMQPTVAKSMEIAEEPSDPGLVKGGLQGTCAGSPAILDTTVANPTQVEEEPNIRGCGFERPQVEEVLQGTIAENFQPAASMLNSFNVDGGNVTEAVNLSEDSPHIVFAKTNAGASIHSAEEVASQEEGFPKEVLLERNPFSSTDFVDPVIQGRSCSKSFKETCTGREVLEGKHLEELSVINGHIQSTQESSHSDCAQSLGQPTAGSHDLGKLGNTKVQMSSEFCNQSIPKLLVENESSDEAGKYKTDLQVQDSRTSESCDLLSESEVKCSYSCCVGCTSTLHQLVKKIIAQEWKLSSSCCTIEDVHDLVSALSSSLCSNIRSILTTEGCSSSENRRLRSRKLECRCESSKNKSENAMECVCHSGNDLSGEAGLSSVNQSESNLTYIFKDGVLIAAQSDKDSLFHCKYDTLCLCSLITLIVSTNQPLD